MKEFNLNQFLTVTCVCALGMASFLARPNPTQAASPSCGGRGGSV